MSANGMGLLDDANQEAFSAWLRARAQGRAASRSGLEKAILAETGKTALVIEVAAGAFVIACHVDDEVDVMPAAMALRPVGVPFLSVREYPDWLWARAAERRERGPFGWFWRAVHRRWGWV